MADTVLKREELALLAQRLKLPAEFIRESLISDKLLNLSAFTEEAGLAGLSLKIEQGLEEARRDLQAFATKGIHCRAFGSPDYPPILREIADAPPLLFYRGEIEPLSQLPCIAMVGARKADLQTCTFARNLAQQIANQGLCVVSGLALGIDGAAHKGALNSAHRYPTVAVLGNGLKSIYPSSHARLAEEILDRGGLLLSQFEPDEPPYPANFLNRNRIIAGLSHATVVIQAGERSGSLVTARNAAEEGREVFVVPGDASNKRFNGSHKLIRDGATLIRDLADLLEDLPEELKLKLATCARDSECSRSESQGERILQLLKERGQVHFSELDQALSGSTNLEVELLQLELSGEISQLPGNFYQLI